MSTVVEISAAIDKLDVKEQVELLRICAARAWFVPIRTSPIVIF